MPDPAPTTPMMEQYERARAKYPGHLVLFRVGDFYEAFGDDARRLSRDVEIVLTARSPDKDGERVPMAGVPQHALESYLARLVRKGYKVAVCDQVEDARFAKGLVRREVTRVVTPGTVVEDRILPGADHNFLASLVVRPGTPAGFAAVDITTGEWFDGAASLPDVEAALLELAPFAPRELLISADADAPAVERAVRREHPTARIEPVSAPAGPSLPDRLRPPSDAPPTVTAASGVLYAYLESAQPRLVPFLERAEVIGVGGRLALDAKTLRHLEVVRPMNPDDPNGATLLSSWDSTVTPSGRRTLSFWFSHPLADPAAIGARQEVVEALLGRGAELLALRAELRGIPDLSRIVTRIASRRVRPPELAALLEGLRAVGRAKEWLDRTEIAILAGRSVRLATPSGLAAQLERAIPAEPPPTSDGPGLFRAGYAADLDEIGATEGAGLQALAALERREQGSTGIRSLKIGYNQVFGYYFDVTRPHLAKVPAHFRRKQTLAGGERFTSDELSRIEESILSARERRSTVEREAWERFLAEIEPSIPAVHRLSRAVGELDALASFALVAQERGYVRPTVDDSAVLQIREGRHPVLDRTMEGRYVPNDAELDADATRLLVLTGPNMSGKSTYMRQVGLLVVLAQVGAFLPAKFARIGVVTGLFTRMGFTDEIGRGKSSFMVEMTEVAEILRSADRGALVLLDEVGRGTSTFDGLAIAWATLRHLHDRTRCRTMVATHYHQLTELIESLPGAANGHLAVREVGDDVVFLHRLVPGSTDRSYGLHVARLAGLPDPLLEDADRLLRRLEAEAPALARPSARRPMGTRYTQAILLAGEPSTSVSEVEAAISALPLESMTPLDAMRFLEEWRRRLARPPPAEGR